MSSAIETQATVLARARLAGERSLLTLAAPELARLAGPGQFAMLRCAAGYDPYLRRALPFLHCRGDTVSFLFEPDDPGLAWLAERDLGDTVSLLGPLGHGFALHPTTRQLLLVALGRQVAPLLALADLALTSSLSIVLLIDATAAGELASIIPGAIELLTVPAQSPGALRVTLSSMLPWAGQVAVLGNEEELRSLASPEALRPGLVQCYVQAHLACGLGWCGSCLTETRRAPRRLCVRGPVIELRELI